MTTLRDALDRLTDDERRLILRSLATRYPAEVERQAAYVHSRRVWYPTPPTPKVTP
ncbi:hypothetical protein AB0K34_13695 [Actinomadura sp. NPDC049382]|uniref:hypothetical protein n=1 Tax=Actinomadura sp. NPDC049382 TaxID=3158220 RepID=UPI00342674BC